MRTSIRVSEGAHLRCFSSAFMRSSLDGRRSAWRRAAPFQDAAQRQITADPKGQQRNTPKTHNPAGAKALSFVPSQRTLVPRSRFFAVLDTSILSGKSKIQKGQRSIPTLRFTPLGMTINKFILRRATCSSVVILRRAPEVPDVRIDRFAYHYLAAKIQKKQLLQRAK